MDELTHYGADDEHGRLSGLAQAGPEGATPGGFVERDHCRHIEGLAQERVPHLGEPGFPMDAAPRELLARVKAGEGRALAGVVKACGLGVEGEQCADGALAQARDTVEEFALTSQLQVLSMRSRMAWITWTTIVARALKELKSHALPKLVDSNSIDGGAGRRPPVPCGEWADPRQCLHLHATHIPHTGGFDPRIVVADRLIEIPKSRLQTQHKRTRHRRETRILTRE